MGRRPVKDKKRPGDYPQFGFRVSVEDKERLAALIEEVQATLNKRAGESSPYINKNDVIVRALYAGLKLIRRNDG